MQSIRDIDHEIRGSVGSEYGVLYAITIYFLRIDGRAPLTQLQIHQKTAAT